MNTLRAFQGVDTAFTVTLSPPGVDFPASPTLVADIHRGDGRAAPVTVAATWANTATDTITVTIPGTATADLEPGNYLLSLRTTAESAYLTWAALVVYPGTAATRPIRSLIAPGEALGVIPEIKGDLGQIDGLTWLLEAATVACERYCGMALVVTDFDHLAYCAPVIDLDGRPVYDFRARSNPGTTYSADVEDYTDDVTDCVIDSARGSIEFYPYSGRVVIGRRCLNFTRLTYRAGYAIDPADVALGVEPVPRDLQSACLMVAVAIREAAKTAGPTQQQGITGASGGYYTKNINETAVPAPARDMLSPYCRQWGVA